VPHRAGPSLDIREDAERFLVDVDVPGLKMEDLSVEVIGNELTVEGKWPIGADDDNATYLRRERAVGEFSRTIVLPTEINSAGAQAVLTEGVMTITLPKADVAKATKIAVKS
jgi:HSP20 family protein